MMDLNLNHVQIIADVIYSEILLLLSKRTMKKAGFVLDFKKDMASVFGVKIKYSVY